MTSDRSALIEEVNRIKWWHTMDLGEGITTPGKDDTARKLKQIRMPASLDGKTVLDVGSWDGFFAFEAERRGAKRVLATDRFSWNGQGWGTKEGFQLARRVLNSKVEDLDVDVLDLSPNTVGVFDVVLFLGVLYHMKHPLLALERIASVTGEMLILETHVDLLFQRRPAIAIYPGNELNQDPTNWVGPNLAAVMAMLRMVGFRRAEVVSRLSLVERVAQGIKDLVVRRESFFRAVQKGRMVFHAWK